MMQFDSQPKLPPIACPKHPPYAPFRSRQNAQPQSNNRKPIRRLPADERSFASGLQIPQFFGGWGASGFDKHMHPSYNAQP